MRLLLDTHVWLATILAPDRIRPTALNTLADMEHELYFSSASAWEIAIKYALGKLPLPEVPRRFLPGRLERDGIQPLAIAIEHTFLVADLPPLHADPFDRLLIAQARAEGMTLVTADRLILAYDVPTLLAW